MVKIILFIWNQLMILFVLPAFLYFFDNLILKTTKKGECIMKNFAMLGKWHVHAPGYAREIAMLRQLAE